MTWDRRSFFVVCPRAVGALVAFATFLMTWDRRSPFVVCPRAVGALLAFATLLSAADTRLSEAAMNGDTAAVRALLQQKADVNAAQADGTTALHWAAFRDDVDMLQLL